MDKSLNKNSQIRNSSLELCRIVAMLLIVFYHSLSQAGLYTDGSITNMVFGKVFGQYGRVAVDLFLILGVWFMVDSKFRAERIERLWTETFFYGILFSIVACLVGGGLSLKDLMRSAMPFFGMPVWYVSAYLALLVVSPFLNVCLSRFDKKTLRLLTLVLFITVCVTATISDYDNRFTAFVWFVFVYIFIFWYKSDSIRLFINAPINLILGCFGAIILGFFSALELMLGNDGSIISTISSVAAQWLHDYKSLPCFLISLLLFEGFLHLNIRTNWLINLLGKSTLSVYIVHQTPAFIPVIWNVIFHLNDYLKADVVTFASYSLFVTFMTFITISILDILRLKTLHNFWKQSHLHLSIIKLINKVYSPIIVEEDSLSGLYLKRELQEGCNNGLK